MLVKDFMGILLGKDKAVFEFVFNGWCASEALCFIGYDVLKQLRPDILDMKIQNFSSFESHSYISVAQERDIVLHYIIFLEDQEVAQDAGIL